MAFAKVDCGILDSTLWQDLAQSRIFLTALFMADPREFDEPLKQIEVGTLNYTGYEAPPGWYGFVAAAGIGIVNRALMDKKSGMEALLKLGEPEIESRSTEFGGRRLIRINGGYAVLTFMKYRDKDHTGAERMRRLRARKKGKVTRNVTSRDATVTQAEDRGQSAEADKDKLARSARSPASEPASQPVSDDVRFLQDLLAPVKGTRTQAKRWEAKIRAKLNGSPLDQGEVRWWTEHCLAECRDPNQKVARPIGYIIAKVTEQLGDPESAYRKRRAEPAPDLEPQRQLARLWELAHLYPELLSTIIEADQYARAHAPLNPQGLRYSDEESIAPIILRRLEEKLGDLDEYIARRAALATPP